MRQSATVSTMAVLALALGIGANTAIFSVVYHVLLRKMPVRDPDSLVHMIHRNTRRAGFESGGSPYADVIEWRETLRTMENVSAWQQNPVNLVVGTEPERILLSKVSHTFFPMLGIQPVLGRGFMAAEDRPGMGRVAVITHELWRRRFNANRNVTGATLKIEGEPYTVVGVLPRGFRFFGQHSEAYVPIALPPTREKVIPVVVYARIRPGVTPAQLKADLAAATEATRARLANYRDWELGTRPLKDWIVPDVRMSLWVMLGAVALLLLMACANVAGLLLARAGARQREIAVRAALGAGRWRLIRQMVAESLPLGVAGGALGLLLAWWGVDALPDTNLGRVPRLQDVRIDGLVLAFTAAVSLVTCLLFSLAPALSLSRTGFHDALREGGRGGGGPRGSRVRPALVVVEVALALVLCVGATLLMRTFYSLSVVHPGFNPEGLMAASLDLPRPQFRGKDQVVDFQRKLIERVRAVPGVKAAGLTTGLPLGGNYFRMSIAVEGKQYAHPREMPMLNYRTADAQCFAALEMPLRRGRPFDERDRVGTEPVIMVNESAARRLFGTDDPLGKRIGPSPKELMTVIGVVADIKNEDVAHATLPEVIFPLSQMPTMGVTIVARLDRNLYPDPARFAPVLRRLVSGIDPNQALYQVASMEKIMADRLEPRRFTMILLIVFSGVAIVLAAVGIYGVLAFSVERRTHEIGVRIALGAREGDVVRMVVGQALLLVAAGLAAGIAGAAALTRLVTSLLYGVKATDPAVFAGAAVILVVVSAAASWFPARRAASVQPVMALRWE